MKDYYPSAMFDLRFQVNHKSPKINRFFQDYDDNPPNTNLYKSLIKT